tara:strand:+ start:1858 stop:2103 length:246 start_codon:yes stop_codon:yes gene_type:complete
MKKFLINLSLFVIIFLSDVNNAYAVIQGWVPPEDYGEADSYEMRIDSSQENNELDIQSVEMSMEDIFGSEQVFPFPPGLGN